VRGSRERRSSRQRLTVLPKIQLLSHFSFNAIPKAALHSRIRAFAETELAELELATDEALGRVEPE